MRALVVGADGFAGRWLLRHLLESGDTVSAVVGPRYSEARPLLGVEPDRIHQLDVRDFAALKSAVRAAEPDGVYYLAAVSQAAGREELREAAGIALIGAVHALMAGAEADSPPRLLYVSSAHVYGHAGSDGQPIDESAPVQPASVYGAAKAAAEAALLQLAPASGVDVVIARPFNHVGPGQHAGFVIPTLAEQVRGIPRGTRGVVRVGVAHTVRDYTDVRDVVRAYRLLLTSGASSGIYNVASGRGLSVREVADALLATAGVSADLEVDDLRARPNDLTSLIGNASRLRSLGWRPERALRDTLRDVLDQVDTAGT
ncbi:MAG TPA: GDP-mannose 4,6-dehydratase [Candidatus Limnocylindria bacterium]|nr:GDP-mannose 4,6-dehydratase [Candidatus Limnocylindria bacterium]